MPTRRNPVVRHGALLRKGGAHTESVSGKRHQSKRQLDDEIDDYFNQRKKSRSKPGKEQDNSAPSSFLNTRFLIAIQHALLTLTCKPT